MVSKGLKDKEVDPEVKILMLTVFDDNKNIFQAISHGANGIYSRKHHSQAARIYCGSPTGGAPMTVSVATQVLKCSSSWTMKREDYNLSDREKHVLQLLVDGYSYKMIASEMFVDFYRYGQKPYQKIYEKLYVNSKKRSCS